MKLRFSLRSALVATSIVAGLITYFDSDAIFFKPVNHLSWIRSAEPVYFGLRQPRFSTQPVRLDYVVFTNQKLTIDEIEQITGRYPPRQICSVMGGTLRKPEGRVSLDDLTTYLELAGDEPNADALLRFADRLPFWAAKGIDLGVAKGTSAYDSTAHTLSNSTNEDILTWIHDRPERDAGTALVRHLMLRQMIRPADAVWLLDRLDEPGIRQAYLTAVDCFADPVTGEPHVELLNWSRRMARPADRRYVQSFLVSAWKQRNTEAAVEYMLDNIAPNDIHPTPFLPKGAAMSNDRSKECAWWKRHLRYERTLAGQDPDWLRKLEIRISDLEGMYPDHHVE